MAEHSSTRSYWNERHRGRGIGGPLGFVTESAHLLPESGTALDIGGGTGRHALWLASRGLDVTLIDVSDVALEMAAAEAERVGLTLDLEQRDIEEDGLPDETWDLILITFFLVRDVLRTLPDHLDPGGVVIIAHPTVRNLERHPRPAQEHLLEDGELALIARRWQDMAILSLDEGWMPEGRHEARLAARKV